MKSSELKKYNALIDKFKGKEIIVIGDVMLDHFVKGSVSRISPEAPVPVVNVEREDFVAGGAGNVAVNLAVLGAKPTVISVLGDDANGIILKQFLENTGADTTKMVTDETRPTTQKVRIIAERQQEEKNQRDAEGRSALSGYKHSGSMSRTF